MQNRIKWNIKSTYDPNWREKREAEKKEREETEIETGTNGESSINQSQTHDNYFAPSHGSIADINEQSNEEEEIFKKT